MIKPKLVKAQDILLKAKEAQEDSTSNSINLKDKWLIEFKQSKVEKNPREEFRRLFR